MATAHRVGGVYYDTTLKRYHDAHGNVIPADEAEAIVAERAEQQADELAESEARIEQEEEARLVRRRAAREGLSVSSAAPGPKKPAPAKQPKAGDPSVAGPDGGPETPPAK